MFHFRSCSLQIFLVVFLLCGLTVSCTAGPDAPAPTPKSEKVRGHLAAARRNMGDPYSGLFLLEQMHQYEQSKKRRGILDGIIQILVPAIGDLLKTAENLEKTLNDAQATVAFIQYMQSRRDPHKEAQKALEAARKENDEVGMALAYRYLALTQPKGKTEQNLEKMEGQMFQGRGEKEKHWREAVARWEKESIKDGPGRIEALCNVGLERVEEGSHDVARFKFKTALALARAEEKRPIAAARLMNVYGMALYEQHRQGLFDFEAAPYQEATYDDFARKYLQEALSILEVQAPDSLELAAVLHNLGRILLDAEEYPAAREMLEKAERIVKSTPNSRARASVLYTLALIAQKQADPARADDYRKRAQEAMPETKPLRGLPNAENAIDIDQRLFHLVLLSMESGQDQTDKKKNGKDEVKKSGLVALSGVKLFATTSVIGSPHDFGLQPEKTENVNGQMALYMTPELREKYKAQWEEMQKKMKEDDKIARAFEDAMDKVLTEIMQNQNYMTGADVMGDSLRGMVVRYAESKIARLVEENKPNEILSLWEGLRVFFASSILLERGMLVGPTAATLQLKDDERSAVTAIFPFYEDTRAILYRASNADAEMDALLDKPKERGPEFQDVLNIYLGCDKQLDETEVKFGDRQQKRWNTIKKHREAVKKTLPSLPTLEAARQNLAPGDLYASFHYGTRRSYLLLVPRQGPVSVHTIDTPRKKLHAQINNLLKAITRRAPLETMTSEGRTLFNTLFPGEAATAVRATHRLFIAPDGLLWNVPFAALVINAEGPPAWLGLERLLCYTQSLTMLRAGTATPVTDPATVLLVGNPKYDPIKNSFYRAMTGGRAPLSLSGAEEEAKVLADLYKVQPLLNDAATEAAIRERMINAALIHIATHGHAIEEPLYAMSSGIYLTAREEQTGNDGMLQAWEILCQTTLNAQLVVLSACQTARGSTAGDGFGRMLRSLQAAGSQASVASQWSVADTSTRLLMEAFHKNLHAGMPKDEALQQAMKALQQTPETALPYYWAPFILVGNPDSLNLKATVEN